MVVVGLKPEIVGEDVPSGGDVVASDEGMNCVDDGTAAVFEGSDGSEDDEPTASVDVAEPSSEVSGEERLEEGLKPELELENGTDIGAGMDELTLKLDPGGGTEVETVADELILKLDPGGGAEVKVGADELTPKLEPNTVTELEREAGGGIIEFDSVKVAVGLLDVTETGMDGGTAVLPGEIDDTGPVVDVLGMLPLTVPGKEELGTTKPELEIGIETRPGVDRLTVKLEPTPITVLKEEANVGMDELDPAGLAEELLTVTKPDTEGDTAVLGGTERNMLDRLMEGNPDVGALNWPVEN